jgi:hypothetical protein
MRPEFKDIFQSHRVEVFRVEENALTHTIVFHTLPLASSALRADLMRAAGAEWKVEFKELGKDWSKPDFLHNPKVTTAPVEIEMEKEEMQAININSRISPKESYMAFHKQCCEKMMAITKAKNSDYTGASEDPFANFAQIGALVQIPQVVEIGFLTRMSDKLSRIGSFVTKGSLKVADESVEDTLLDLANYCILFAGYLRSKRAP